MEENAINHQKILVTPLWPQTNSEAENFLKPLTKAIQSAHVEGKQWTKHLHIFLLNYRTTPHTTTGYAPATLLFNRKVRNKLPSLEVHSSKHKVQEVVQRNDRRVKDKMKEYADKKRRAQKSNLKIGDTVLVRQRKQNKFSTRFDSKPWEVVRKKGTMVTACRDGKYITRSISQFKVIDSSLKEPDQGEDEDDEDLNTDDIVATPPNPPVQQRPNPPAQLRRSQRSKNPPHRYGTVVYT